MLKDGGQTMTKDEFLRDPVASYYEGSIRDLPSDWLRDAWDIEETDPEKSLRLSVTGEIWREVNKGCLPLIEGELQWLASFLQSNQVVQLYEDLRSDEPHREAEIRSAFLKSFPQSATALPPALSRGEIIAMLGEELARDLDVF
jgi:hypothetical protein